MKLKYRLFRLGRTVIFQVLEMDERFRASEDRNCEFSSKSDILVQSVSGPAVDEGVVSLRGDCPEYDFDANILEHESVEEADAYVQKVHEAIADWAQNWEGWKQKSAISRETDGESLVPFFTV